MLKQTKQLLQVRQFLLDSFGQDSSVSGCQLVFDSAIEMLNDFLDQPEPNYSEMSIPELALSLKNVKSELEEIGKVKTDMQLRYDFLSTEVIPDRMDEEGIDSIKVTNVGRLQVSGDIRCSVLSENKEAVKDWLRDNGHGSMIVSDFNASTFKAFIKEQIKNEAEYPVDLIKVTPYSRANVVKG